MEITIEEIQKKFESLPEDLKWAIMGAKVDENITEIGNLLGLNVEQMGQLSLETHMVMFGFTPPDKFEESLKGSMGLPDEKIKSIMNAVNEKILKKIREELMSMTEDKDEEEIEDIETENKENDNVLKSAGIEIMSEELGSGHIEDKKNISSVSTQKLTGSFQIPQTKTEYTLNNISKQNSQNIKTPAVNITLNTNTSNNPMSDKKIDPYREIPE